VKFAFSKVKFVPAARLVGIEPNPGPGVRKHPHVRHHLSEEDRWRIVFLRRELKLSEKEIAKRIPTTQKTVSLILQKHQQTGTVHNQAGQGRKRKYLPADEKTLVRKAKRGKKAKELARDYSTRRGVTISERTVRRILKRNHLAYLRRKRVQRLTSDHKQARIDYARDKMNANWKSVVFLDEKSFWLESTETHAWQEPGKERKVQEKSRWTKKIHVFGGIGSYFKTDLYFFEENLTSELYQTIIKARLPPAITAPDIPHSIRNKWVIVQDNDPKHTADEAMELMKELCGDRIHNHPANSPDLNVMEDAWSYLDRMVKKCNIKTIPGLKRKLKQLWIDLPWNEIRKSVDSMPARLQQCLARKGGRTDY
jgi:transposase